jgi:hypothetical protein
LYLGSILTQEKRAVFLAGKHTISSELSARSNITKHGKQAQKPVTTRPLCARLPVRMGVINARSSVYWEYKRSGCPLSAVKLAEVRSLPLCNMHNYPREEMRNSRGNHCFLGEDTVIARLRKMILCKKYDFWR